MNICAHCGMIHQMTCPRIKAIEYNANGVTIKRIEFHEPKPVVAGTDWKYSSRTMGSADS